MPTPQIDGPRACTKADLPEVIALANSSLGRGGTDRTVLTDYPLIYQDKNLENVRILRVDGELASVVPFIVWPIDFGGCRFSIGGISPTATAVPHRMKGYGRQCLEDCLRKMEAMGCELSILRTKVATFPFYACGDYQAVQNQAWIYPCTREDAGRFVPHGEAIVERNQLADDELAAVRAMHEAEGGGSYRSPERYGPLFSLPKMKALLAYRGKTPVAYLLVSNALNMPGLLEAGGDEAAVETLVHRALSELGETETRIGHGNLNPSVLDGLLEKRLPGRRQPTAENRMVRINRPAAFLRRIAPWMERENRGVERAFSVTTGGETVSFRFGPGGLSLGTDRLDPHHELSRRQLVSAVFGDHPSYPPAPAVHLGGLPPFYFPVWLLDRS